MLILHTLCLYIVYIKLSCHLLLPLYPFFKGAGVVTGANPSCFWAKAGYTLNKSPAHCRALTDGNCNQEQFGAQYLAQRHFDMQLRESPGEPGFEPVFR